MKNTLKDLWFGNILPCDQTRMADTEHQELRKKYSEYDKQLKGMLSQEANTLEEKKEEIASQLSTYFETEAFINGFRLGVKLMLEVLQE